MHSRCLPDTPNPLHRRTFSALAALLLLAAPALAEPAYLDDRSDPAALIRSYYNAVARHEYARAWSYFGEAKPVADYPSFTAGYADTESVELSLGPVTTDGAAGSIYASVPVAIAATGPAGTSVFAGCYTTRQIQPVIQEPPFRPLQIERARLAKADGPARRRTAGELRTVSRRNGLRRSPQTLPPRRNRFATQPLLGYAR